MAWGEENSAQQGKFGAIARTGSSKSLTSNSGPYNARLRRGPGARAHVVDETIDGSVLSLRLIADRKRILIESRQNDSLG